MTVKYPGVAEMQQLMAYTDVAESWRRDCIQLWGRVLNGLFAHRCPYWGYLPIDETTQEQFDHCPCYPPNSETAD